MKREMTPELRKKLAGLLPVSQEKGIGFTPDVYKDAGEYAPTFYLRPWTVDEQNAYLSDLEGLKENPNVNKMIFDYGFGSIVKVENLFELSGDEIKEFNRSVYDSLPLSVKMSLFNQVQRISGLLQLEAEGLG